MKKQNWRKNKDLTVTFPKKTIPTDKKDATKPDPWLILLSMSLYLIMMINSYKNKY